MRDTSLVSAPSSELEETVGPGPGLGGPWERLPGGLEGLGDCGLAEVAFDDVGLPVDEAGRYTALRASAGGDVASSMSVLQATNGYAKPHEPAAKDRASY